MYMKGLYPTSFPGGETLGTRLGIPFCATSYYSFLPWLSVAANIYEEFLCQKSSFKDNLAVIIFGTTDEKVSLALSFDECNIRAYICIFAVQDYKSNYMW